MRDISNLISAVTIESALATSAVNALIAAEQHLQDAQAQVAVLQQQAAQNALDPDQVTKLLDTVSTTTAQLSAAIPANVVPSGSPVLPAASDQASAITGAVVPPSGTVVIEGATALPAAAVQARDAAPAAAPVVPVAGAAGAPGAYAQPTDSATAGLAAGPGPVAAV